jgi:hypothetical protein
VVRLVLADLGEALRRGRLARQVRPLRKAGVHDFDLVPLSGDGLAKIVSVTPDQPR